MEQDPAASAEKKQKQQSQALLQEAIAGIDQKEFKQFIDVAQKRLTIPFHLFGHACIVACAAVRSLAKHSKSNLGELSVGDFFAKLDDFNLLEKKENAHDVVAKMLSRSPPVPNSGPAAVSSGPMEYLTTVAAGARSSPTSPLAPAAPALAALAQAAPAPAAPAPAAAARMLATVPPKKDEKKKTEKTDSDEPIRLPPSASASAAAAQKSTASEKKSPSSNQAPAPAATVSTAAESAAAPLVSPAKRKAQDDNIAKEPPKRTKVETKPESTKEGESESENEDESESENGSESESKKEEGSGARRKRIMNDYD